MTNKVEHTPAGIVWPKVTSLFEEGGYKEPFIDKAKRELAEFDQELAAAKLKYNVERHAHIRVFFRALVREQNGFVLEGVITPEESINDIFTRLHGGTFRVGYID